MVGLLDGKHAVVTGASGDIGSKVAVALASSGAEVVGTFNRGTAGAERLKGTAGELGLPLKVVNLDVSDEQAVSRFFDALSPGPDILVNVAGHSDRRLWFASPGEIGRQEWLDVYLVDVVGTFNCTREAAKYMGSTDSGGSVVNFSSAAALTGHFEGLPYTAAKSALLGLTKSLAAIYGPKVRVNAIAPGNVDAGSIRWHTQEQIEAMKAESDMKRLGTASEVAQAVLFLASDMSSYVTGQVLAVDGGI